MKQTTTEKSFINLASFSKEVLVCCPHCNQRAMVTTSLPQATVPYPTGDTTSKFRCNNCYKPINERLWYGPVIIFPVNAKCENCGTALKDEKRLVKKYQSKMKVKCQGCGQAKFYDTKYEYAYSNSNQATDPYFGLPLWLQAPFGANILWAYNFDHLCYLKKYISAKLREATFGGKYSLAWKLPNFITTAKNRDHLLKAIERLERK